MGVDDVEVRRVFVDTAWNRKPHACYDPESDEFFEVQRLADLKDYEEIYLDSLLFPGIWSELRELIIDGHKVYHFTRSWWWRKLRKRFSGDLRDRFKSRNVRKSDFGDAYILWKVYEMGVAKGNMHKWFKPISVVDVELRPLLMKEAIVAKTVDRLEKLKDVDVQVDEVKEMKELLRRVRREIVEKGFKLMPWLSRVSRELGLERDDLNALTGLIGLMTYMKQVSYHKALRYLGLYRARNKEIKRCSGKARRYLMMVAISMVSREGRWPPRLRDLRATLRKLITTMHGLEPLGSRRGEGHGNASSAIQGPK
ncbi:MAG: hypothetical protein B6U65_01200 [Candidatus Wolframiiraptor sp. EX4484-121]|nr:MAG: hypothetical protein B6U65_01200 [Candidatus Wolframiiraptor sp. EX4484-121]